MDWIVEQTPDLVVLTSTAGTGADESVARETALAPVDPAQALAGPPTSVVFADLSDYFCSALECPAVIGNVIVSLDRSHISGTYSHAFAKALLAVAPVLR